jgi:molybdopterin-guanine dinucleotide biosynthesis protein A
MRGFAAVILAGGAGRRLGGARKPLLPVGGRTMLDRVLAAVADAAPRVVVGPAELAVPSGVWRVSEEPPGGGPVAALAAGLAVVDTEEVAVLAADLPFLTRQAIQTLRTALQQSTVDGAIYVDDQGRRQTLCGVWRTDALRSALRERPGHRGAALRHLLAGLRIREVADVSGESEVARDTAGPPPWYDCDSPEDLDRAEGWT